MNQQREPGRWPRVKKRIPWVVLVIGVILMGNVVALHAGWAQDPSRPDAIDVPAAQPGDSGSYTQLALADQSAQSVFAFEWLPPGVERDSNSWQRPVERFHMSNDTARDPYRVIDRFAIDAGEGTLVSHTHVQAGNQGESSRVHGGLSQLFVETKVDSAITSYPDVKSAVLTTAPPCGFPEAHQPRSQSLSQEWVLVTDCALFFDQGLAIHIPSGTSLGPTDHATVFGRPAAAFEAHLEHGVARIWLTETIAYPFQYEWRPDETGTTSIVRLGVLEQHLDRPREVSLESDTTRTFSGATQRLPWGPFDYDLEHPFTLSSAFSFARADKTDPAFEEFLQKNPDAYTVRAEYSEYDTGSRYGVAQKDSYRTFTWRITVTNGVDVLTVCPELRHRPLGVQTPVTDQDDFFTLKQKTKAQNCPEPQDVPLVEPSKVPERMLQVSPLMERWRQHASDRFADDAAHAYGFQLVCETNDCNDPDWLIWAGHAHKALRLDYDNGALIFDSLRTNRTSLAFFNDRGEIVTLAEFEEQDNHMYGATSPPVLPDGPLVKSVVNPLVFGTEPKPLLLVGGILAVLGGAWLVVRSALNSGWARMIVGIPMFSRLARSRVLDHDARRRVYELIQAKPGISLPDVTAQCGMGRSSIRHHLRVLQAHRQIRSFKVQGVWRFGPMTTDKARLVTDTRLGQDPSLRALVDFVQRQKQAQAQAAIQHLCTEHAMTESGAWKVIRRAIRHGVVDSHRQGRVRVLQAALEQDAAPTSSGASVDAASSA